MNRFLPSLVPLCAVLLIGCPDQEGTEDATPADLGPKDTGADGGVDTGIDTGVDTGADTGVEDGSTDDTGADGGMQDTGTSTSGEVVVHVETGGVPFPITVLFHDQSGALVLETMLDANGDARAELDEGGMVTLVIVVSGKGQDFYALQTVTDLHPPETLTIDFGGGVSSATSLEVGVPGPFAGADTYTVEFGCYENGITDPSVPESLFIEDSCVGSQGDFGVLAEARDTSYAIIAYAALDNVAFPPPASVTVPGPWRTDFATLDVSYTNAGPAIGQISFAANLVREGRPYVGFYGSDVPVGGAVTFPWQAPMFGDAVDLDTTLTATVDASGRYFVRSPPGAPIQIDVADALPFPSDLQLDQTAPERPVFHWSNGAPVMADLGLLSFSTDQMLSWAVALPAGADSFTVPELPESLALLRPNAATVFQSSGYGLFDSTLDADFRALRDRETNDLPGAYGQQSIPPTAPVGTVVRNAVLGYLGL